MEAWQIAFDRILGRLEEADQKYPGLRIGVGAGKAASPEQARRHCGSHLIYGVWTAWIDGPNWDFWLWDKWLNEEAGKLAQKSKYTQADHDKVESLRQEAKEGVKLFRILANEIVQIMRGVEDRFFPNFKYAKVCCPLWVSLATFLLSRRWV